MTMRKKTLLFAIILLLVLSLTACARGRLRDRWTSPDASSAQVEEQPQEIPQKMDTGSSEGSSSQTDELSGDIEGLDALLDELDDILKYTDTNVDIP